MTARLDGSGILTLDVDKKAAAVPVSGKLPSRMPTDGLDVGSDRNGAVGPYSSPNPFSGMIKSVAIEIDSK